MPPQRRQEQRASGIPRMIVCGDDALAYRLGDELARVYRVQATVIVSGTPAAGGRERGPAGEPVTARAAAFFDRFATAAGRAARAPLSGQAVAAPGESVSTGGSGETPTGPEVLVVETVDDELLLEVGVQEATALAFVYDDDERNIHSSLRARRLNPRLRLVIRMYNRRLGAHLEALLDQAAAEADPDLDPEGVDASTTVLSDADTAAPALAGTVIAGTSKVVHADGLLLRAVERPPGPGVATGPELCTLALLPPAQGEAAGQTFRTRANSLAGQSGRRQGAADIESLDTEEVALGARRHYSAGARSGTGAQGRQPRSRPEANPDLLPDDSMIAAGRDRATVVLEAVAAPAVTQTARPQRLISLRAPISSLLSLRLRWTVVGMLGVVLALGVVSSFLTGEEPLHAAYLSMLDVLGTGDPAVDKPVSRQILQLLSAFTGLLLLPVLVAATFEALGTFRTAYMLRRPPRNLHGHIVLLGLGKIGSRVLTRLRELDIPVVCVEEDPDARGIPLARRLRVPTVLGDVTEEGVLEAAKVDKAAALLALTSSDTTNLEAVLYARGIKPDLKVVLRLYEDRFARAVYRTLRTAHPQGVTRSRSVTNLAAPAFAAAMMGRQIIGAVPVERKVLLLADLPVNGHPALSGKTVAQAFAAGRWRILAVNPSSHTASQEPPAAASAWDPRHEAGAEPRFLWAPDPRYVLGHHDRVVVATTRQGLADLLVGEPTTGGR